MGRVAARKGLAELELAGYRTIPSFEEYLVASQKEARIERFTRQADRSWNLRIFGPGERVELSSVGCAVEVDRVYEGVFELGRETAG